MSNTLCLTPHIKAISSVQNNEPRIPDTEQIGTQLHRKSPTATMEESNRKSIMANMHKISGGSVFEHTCTGPTVRVDQQPSTISWRGQRILIKTEMLSRLRIQPGPRSPDVTLSNSFATLRLLNDDPESDAVPEYRELVAPLFNPDDFDHRPPAFLFEFRMLTLGKWKAVIRIYLTESGPPVLWGEAQTDAFEVCAALPCCISFSDGF